MLELELQMVESQHLVCERTSALNTEQSSSPFVCPLNLVCWGITFKSQASGMHMVSMLLPKTCLYH